MAYKLLIYIGLLVFEPLVKEKFSSDRVELCLPLGNLHHIAQSKQFQPFQTIQSAVRKSFKCVFFSGKVGNFNDRTCPSYLKRLDHETPPTPTQ